MCDEKRPSSRKVIKLLKCVPASDAENQCLDHLKRYIKSLQGQSLTRFLQFTTGSDIIVTEQIKVDFVGVFNVKILLICCYLLSNKLILCYLELLLLFCEHNW